MTHDVHLVGSIPLSSAEEVFTVASDALGARLKRIPDGETGERSHWLGWLGPVFAAQPALELSGEVFRVHEQAAPRQRYRLREGARASDVDFDPLPYAGFALDSYATFRRLRDAGRIPTGTKFQVDFAPAHSAVRTHVVDELLPQLEPRYDDAIISSVAAVAAAIPHRDLAIQFDVASAVFCVLQRGDFQAYGKTKGQAAEAFGRILARLGDSVPDGVDLLFHFCYGDNNHRHAVEPVDMGDMVDMANRLRNIVNRRIDLIHMPVPRDRTDEAYFAPLRGLDLAPETELALGLVHLTGGIDGVRKRLEAARKFVTGFAIATECGFGRRDPETIAELLRLHAEATELD